MKTVSIMQPYLFPYSGYFGLIVASDQFIIYDDVNYIIKGWINRNNIIINGKKHLFTVPVSSSSRNLKINEVKLHDFVKFRGKFCKKLELAYKKAPFFEQGMSYTEAVMSKNHTFLTDLSVDSIETILELLKIKKTIVRSSSLPNHLQNLEREKRLIEISKEFGAQRYINSAGGAALYSKSRFLDAGLELSFLKPQFHEYTQHNTPEFLPGLSIIDLMMNTDLKFVSDAIHSYSLS